MTNPRQQVSRQRRFVFVSGVTAFCLIASVALVAAFGIGALGASDALLRTVVDGMMALATAISLAYITGSVIDYTVGGGSLLRRDPPEVRG